MRALPAQLPCDNRAACPIRIRGSTRLAVHRWPLIATLLLVASGCGDAVPSPSPTRRPRRPPSPSAATGSPVGLAEPEPTRARTLDAIYDAIEEQVVEIRGLQPTARRSTRQVIDEAELRTLITEQFDEETPPAYLAANERLYKALGLIPARRRPARPDASTC